MYIGNNWNDGFPIQNDMYRCTRNQWNDGFPIQNDLKQRDASLPMLSNFNLEYTVRKVQENWGLKLKETHQLPVYAHDNLLGENINTLKKNILDICI
jgi:hypothetical protein